jgi:hypothetical protein
MKARILIVDDHEVVREGLKALLAKARPEWETCGEATTGEQAIEFVRDLKPDIVLLDITMPGIGGFEACSRMRKLGLSLPRPDIHHASIGEAWPRGPQGRRPRLRCESTSVPRPRACDGTPCWPEALSSVHRRSPANPEGRQPNLSILLRVGLAPALA